MSERGANGGRWRQINFGTYTLSSGLKVHPVHVSWTEEDGLVTQGRFWATVVQIGDPSYAHARIDIDVLQPKFQGLHYGMQTIDEVRRGKKRRTVATKKEESKVAQERNEEWDDMSQWWDSIQWEQDQVEIWRQELKERELAVAAHEAAVFQCELEYRRLECCPMCGKRGRNGGAQGQ